MKTTTTDLLTIEMTSNASDERPVFLAGTFNDWRANDPHFQMKRLEPGKYRFVFSADLPIRRPFEYKYTRGDWAEVEIDEYGCRTANRKSKKEKGVITDFVPRWRRHGWAYWHHLLPKIRIINEHFAIPQLNKTRKVSVLLPADYHETNHRYPVLYMQDGQNLFDENAPFGNWAIDQRLAVLKELGMGDVIVVAIDHGEKSRITEFMPGDSLSLKIGKGEGTLFLDFMVNTLKPYIDQHYRTLTDNQHTGFGGSSMGGLISLYAGLLHPKTFGKIMVFSPSVWIFPQVFEDLKNFQPSSLVRFYLYAGKKESTQMERQITEINGSFSQKSTAFPIETKLVIDPHGEHNEVRWGVEFPRALAWLFFNRF